MNSVNSPTSLSTVIVPPCCVVTMSWLIERPRHVPSPVGVVVKNGWNSFSRCSGAMPVPLSRTLTSTALRRARVATLSTGAEAVAGLAAALIGGIEAVANQVQEHARHVLRHDVDRREVAVEVAFHRDVEALVLGAGAVIGEVEGLIDQRVEINLLPITATPARVLQHALDNAVRPPSVLGDLVEIARQHRDRVIDLGAGAVIERRQCRCRGFLQLIQQLDREASEVVDEVERVLDLVSDPGGELTQRRHLLLDHELLLGPCNSPSAFSAASRAARISASAC